MIFQRFLLLEEIEDKNQLNSTQIDIIDTQGTDDRTQQRLLVEDMSAKWNPDMDVSTLKDISLTLKDGELLAVIGPVGAGKV